MSFTPADVIVEVREMMQDTDVPYRYSDDFVLRKVNQAFKRLSVIRPDLFSTVDTITCVAGRLQAAPDDSLRLMDVIGNTAGSTVKEVNQDTLDLMTQTWPSGTAGPAVDWMRYPRDPNRFFVWPPSTNVDTLQIVYAQSPPAYASGDSVLLQDAYMPLVVDCTIWLLESVDAEHVESGRAKMFKDSFAEMATAGLQARKITDTDTAGEAPGDTPA